MLRFSITRSLPHFPVSHLAGSPRRFARTRFSVSRKWLQVGTVVIASRILMARFQHFLHTARQVQKVARDADVNKVLGGNGGHSTRPRGLRASMRHPVRIRVAGRLRQTHTSPVSSSHLFRDVSPQEHRKLWTLSYSALMVRQWIHVSASVHSALG